MQYVCATDIRYYSRTLVPTIYQERADLLNEAAYLQDTHAFPRKVILAILQPVDAKLLLNDASLYFLFCSLFQHYHN